MKDKCKYKYKCKCGKSIPIFNFKGNTNGVCCSKCKEPGMIDIKNIKKSNINKNNKEVYLEKEYNLISYEKNNDINKSIITIDFRDLIYDKNL